MFELVFVLRGDVSAAWMQQSAGKVGNQQFPQVADDLFKKLLEALNFRGVVTPKIATYADAAHAGDRAFAIQMDTFHFSEEAFNNLRLFLYAELVALGVAGKIRLSEIENIPQQSSYELDFEGRVARKLVEFLTARVCVVADGISVPSTPSINEARLQSSGFNMSQVPQDFVCPLSLELMDVPAFTSGRPASLANLFGLEQAILRHRRHPFTNEPIVGDFTVEVNEDLLDSILCLVERAEYLKKQNPASRRLSQEDCQLALVSKPVEFLSSSGDSVSLNSAGVRYQKQHRYSSAIACFEEVRRLSQASQQPDEQKIYSVASFNLGATYVKVGKELLALPLLAEVLELDEQSKASAAVRSKHFEKYADALAAIGRNQDASQIYQAAFEAHSQVERVRNPAAEFAARVVLAREFKELMPPSKLRECLALNSRAAPESAELEHQKRALLLRNNARYYHFRTPSVLAKISTIQNAWRASLEGKKLARRIEDKMRRGNRSTLPTLALANRALSCRLFGKTKRLLDELDQPASRKGFQK